MFLCLHDLLYAISVHVFDGHTSELMLYKKLAYGKSTQVSISPVAWKNTMWTILIWEENQI